MTTLKMSLFTVVYNKSRWQKAHRGHAFVIYSLEKQRMWCVSGIIRYGRVVNCFAGLYNMTLPNRLGFLKSLPCCCRGWMPY